MRHRGVGKDDVLSVRDRWELELDAVSSLVLGSCFFVPWVTHRRGVTVRRLSTQYGPVSYTMRREAGGVRVSIQTGTRIPPGGIIVASPFAQPPRQALVNGVATGGSSPVTAVVRTLPAEVVFRL